ncbi:MAG: hypothetical protein A4E58_00361 [Syntrophorhabdus sp. PtaB.Bin006]|nr:MAG: hypothetical protein A4E58_00361 [Syntrophorhabdus sp. PtaB.Bin006]
MQGGSCRVTIEPPNLFVTPQSGPSLSIDLGDIDLLVPGDYQLSLTLYTGKILVLTKFAKVFQNLSADLLQTYRDRLVRCLLLEDLEEIERFEGYVDVDASDANFSSPAELRLYQSNLAILPEKAVVFQWRLADIDGIEFDDAAYRLIILSGSSRLTVTKLAKRTGEFVERLRSAVDAVSENTSAIVRSLCPFLSPDQVLETSRLMREGRAAAFSKLSRVHPGIEQSLIANGIDRSLKPYFEVLKQKMFGSEWFAGFKMVRPETDSEAEPGPDEPVVDSSPAVAAERSMPVAKKSEGSEKERSILYWFFFPLRGATGGEIPNVIAWESTSLSGHATFFFKTPTVYSSGDVHDNTTYLEYAVRQLNQALVTLNFRREPVYLSDVSLQTEARYHQYAIACRKISALRELRASYLGRAIHASVDVWQKQVEAILNKREASG